MIVLILIGMIPMLVFSRVLIESYQSTAMTQKIKELNAYATIISNQVIDSSFFSGEDLTEINAELSQVAEGYRGRILVLDSGLRVVKDTYGLQEGKTIISKNVVQSFQGTRSKYVNDVDNYVELTIPIMNQETKIISGSLLINFSTENINEIYQNLNRISFTIYFIIAIIIVILAVLYSTFSMKPLKEVTHSIDLITEGYLDGTVSIRGFTEVESISDSFNRMIIMLQNLEESRQEFVSNVSHELKTPITSIKVLADSLLIQDEVPNELYKEFLLDITNEIERVNKIINDLLSLVKMDKSATNMVIGIVNINEFLEKIMKQLRPIAAKRNIELVYESFRPVSAEVDEIKLSMAFTNLIENAIKYNYDDGWVRVSLNADHKFFYIKVADSGVGIPEELQDNIFERFFRVDKARSRDTGGTGLGLSITRNAILMHRGSIKVYSKEKEGTVFTVRIPINYVI